MKNKQQGFTLIELLLVVVIIGILLAVIVPRAWRANIDAKYGLVRQNATELAAFASQWAEQQMEAQDLTSEATIYSYLSSLAQLGGPTPFGAAWVAGGTDSDDNWTDTVEIIGRQMNGDDDQPPEASVEDIVPPERVPRNPFNGANIFASTNNPRANNSPIPGAIACGSQPDDDFAYFAFLFQGTDSTHWWFQGHLQDGNSFHAGQDITTLAGLRNGVFMARVAQ